MQRREFLSTVTKAIGVVALPSLLSAASQDRRIVRYPDPWISVIDPQFAKYRIRNAIVERLHTGTRWAEGPVWFGDGRFLLWSDIPNNRMLRWTQETGMVSEYRNPANNSNGNTRDLEGHLITCEQGTRRVTRTEYNGKVTVLIDKHRGKRLNAPNDIVAHPDGSFWFTDPGYGTRPGDFELLTNVYRLDPKTGGAQVVTEELERPNGLCFSPDYSKLYISDTGPTLPRSTFVYDVGE